MGHEGVSQTRMSHGWKVQTMGAVVVAVVAANPNCTFLKAHGTSNLIEIDF